MEKNKRDRNCDKYCEFNTTWRLFDNNMSNIISNELPNIHVHTEETSGMYDTTIQQNS
jgi:hypothetical protein